MPAGPAPARVFIASDGKRGHENQSRVVARMLGDSEPLLLHLRPGVVELPLRLRLALLGRELDQDQAAGLVQRMLQPESPVLFKEFAREFTTQHGQMELFTVSTGTPPATLNLVLRSMLRARAVVNMTPSLLPRRYFELNIVPAHDLPPGRPVPANVLATPLALGFHDALAGEHLASRIRRENGLDPEGRYAGLAVGGPSKSVAWSDEHVMAQLTRLLGWAARNGARVLATTSRRTPRALAEYLEERSGPGGEVAYLLDAARDPLNPLPAFYETCQVMAVTADSFSMACEAVQAGHRPVLLETDDKVNRGKLARSLGTLRERGLVHTLDELVAGTSPVRGPANEFYEELKREVQARLNLL